MSSAPPLNLRFGNHEILTGPGGEPLLLGEGSFGKTYKARHIFLGTEAALKVIRPDPDTFEKARTQFLKEARSAAQLRHPHIALIHDFGESEGALYYAMEFCAGGDLHRYLDKHGPFSVEAALPLFRQSAGALLCAHERGFLHRDLKPSNFLFATAEPPLDVKLIDFGLVKEFASSPKSGPGETQGPVTETAHFAGTPLFASPEQLREEVLDERSDIFALGMTWWFLLTGKPVVSGATAQVVAERLRPGDYASQLPGSLPSALRDLLASMLAKERALRPANVREVLEALHAMETPGGLSPARRRPSASHWETRQGALLSLFPAEGPGEPAPGGSVAPAVDSADGRKIWLLIFDDPAVSTPEGREQIVKNAQALAKIESENLLPLLGLVRATDGYAALYARDPGVPLLDVLKASGDLPFHECLAQLQALAKTIDSLEMAGLPPADLTPHALIADAKTHQEGFNAPGARVLIRPALVRPAAGGSDDFEASSGATMIVESGSGRPCQAFAALIYRLVSGRALNAAARIAPEAFVTVSALSEEGNRILSEAVLDSAEPFTCSGLLARLCEAEGVSASPAAGPPSASQPAAASQAAGASRIGSLLRSSSVSVSVSLSPSATASRAPGTSPPPPQAAAASRAGVTPPPLPQATVAPRAAGPPPPPPAARKPAAAPPPAAAQPSHNIIPIALGIAALAGLALVLTGLLLWRGGKPARDTSPPKTAATPAPTPAPGPAKEPPKAPSHFAFTGGIIPQTVSFTVNGLPVVPEVDSSGVRVPLATAGVLPLKITISAPGYKAKTFEITEASGDTHADPVRLGRATGEITFAGAEESDYTEATFKMIERLPEEKEVRPEASPYTFPIKSASASRKLSTGIYEVILRGADPALVQPRKQPEPVEVREGKTTEIALPKTVTGTYTGQDPGGGAVELVIDRDLRGGKITRTIDGAAHSLTLGPARLDNTGGVTAETAPDPSGAVWRIELARAEPAAKPALTISNALTPPGQIPAPPIRVELDRR